MDSKQQEIESVDDLSALAWVHDELRRSIETAHKALRRHVRESEAVTQSDVDAVDPTILRGARSHLHQGVGALELVGLSAAAQMLRASENAVVKLTARGNHLTDKACDAIERSSFGLLDYLGRMLAGKPVSPVALFPQYKAVQELAGADRIHPADLWPHDWRWRDVPPADIPARRADDETRAIIEGATLALMRQPHGEAAQELSNVYAGLAQGVIADGRDRRLATLWQLASGFFEGQTLGMLPSDVYTKRITSRLMAQMRMSERPAGEGSPAADVSDRLAQDLLFFCAQAGAPKPGRRAQRLAAVRQAWGLSQAAPVNYGAAQLGKFDPAWIAQAKKRVSAAKESWSGIAAEEKHRIQSLNEQFHLVGESLSKLYPEGARLASSLQDAAADTVRRDAIPTPGLAMEVATALLYVEASLEDADFDHPGQGSRVTRLAERIVDVRQGGDPRALDPWMEELYRRVADRQTMGSVVQELRSALGESEKAIDQYFRDPSKRELLMPVPSQLQAMRGVLSVLGLEHASQTIVRMRDDVEPLLSATVDAKEAADQGVFDRMASNLGALGFMIDMLSVQPQMAKSLFRFDSEAGLLRSVVRRAGAGRDSGFGSLDSGAMVEPQLVEQVEALALTASKADVADDVVERDLERLSQEAMVNDQRALAETMASVKTALRHAKSGEEKKAVRDELAQAMADFVQSTAEPTALQPGLAPLPTSYVSTAPTGPTPEGQTGLEGDDEMRAIFLEEARDVIDGARQSLARLEAAPEDITELTTVRRAFHTLKGSSRMVGLQEFGEAAWACEQLYNARLADRAVADSDLRGFSSEALGYLSDWVDSIEAGRSGGHAPSMVQAAADALRLHGRRQVLVLPNADQPSGQGARTSASTFDAEPVSDPLKFDSSPDILGSADANPRLVGSKASHALPAEPSMLDALPDGPVTRQATLHPPPVSQPASGAMPSVDRRLPAGAVGTVASVLGALSLDLKTQPAPMDAVPSTSKAPQPSVPKQAFPDQASGAAAADDRRGFVDTQPALSEREAAELEAQARQAAEREREAQARAEEAARREAEALAERERLAREEQARAAREAAEKEAAAKAAAAKSAAREAARDADMRAAAERHAAEERSAAEARAAAAAAAAAAAPLVVPMSPPSPTNEAQASEHGAEGIEPKPHESDNVKLIGDLRVPIPLFNIYINEADEQSRRLDTALAEWQLELHRPVGEVAEALAHSLAGNSSTVGYTALSQLARSLEHALGRSNEIGKGTVPEAQLFVDVAHEIRRLLHQFSAGILKSPQPELLTRLAAHEIKGAALRQTRQGRGSSAPADVAPKKPARVGSARATRPAPLLSADDDIDAVDSIDEELFAIFEEEGLELFPKLESQMREWVDDPGNAAPASACLRSLHTIKGGARLAGAMRLGEMAHRLESSIETLVSRGDVEAHEVEELQARADNLGGVFDALRGHVRPLLDHDDATADLDAMLATSSPANNSAGVTRPAMLDTVSPSVATPGPVPAPAPMPSQVAASPSTVPTQPKEVADATPQTSSKPTATPTVVAAPGAIDWRRFKRPTAAKATKVALNPAAASGAVRVKSALLDKLVNHAGEVSITRSRIDADVAQLKGAIVDLTDNLDRMRNQLREIELQAESQISSRLEAVKVEGQGFDPLEMDRFTRFQELTRMLAESVNDVATVHRGLQRTVQSTEDQLAAQARLTRELQDNLLRTRMVEFDSLADRLYRVVRQAAKETGKQVRLDIANGTIEVDRGVLERMVGSLEHLLRNCITHGVELPTVRSAAGKDPIGTVSITLHQEGNEVGIEVRDDGAGLDFPRIRERAVAQGLLRPDAQPSEAELAPMIFAPGFTTMTEVTELAGRGVGMDVVRNEVNALGGRVETHSVTGQGVSFKLVVPLTTAVTQVVMLRAGDLTVAMPSTLVELVKRMDGKERDHAYATGRFADGASGDLAFHWLGALLLHSARSQDAADKSLPVVIVRSAQQRVAIHVDEVLGNQEVVVKNLGPQLSRLPGLSGITLLPSGQIVLIYNPVALAHLYGSAVRLAEIERRQREATDRHSPAADAGLPLMSSAKAQDKAPLVLVVDDSLTVRRVTQRMLQREGYRVSLAKDGLDGLEKLAEERPAVLLSDIEMPRMDGFDLVRNLRGDARWRDLPVIMITSRIAQKHKDHAVTLGVNHYLGKPYSEEELLQLIGRYTGQAATTPRH